MSRRTRVSKPPNKTRYDAQIDSNNYLLTNSIRFKPVRYGLANGKNRYRLKLENDNDRIVDLNAIKDELQTAGLNLRVSAVENIINTLCEIIPKYIAETGNAVRIGNLVTLKAYATGSLAHENDAPNPDENRIEIRAVACPSLRHSLAKARLTNSIR